ncbi:MAG: type II secretion system protein GspE [Acidobacteria bacterium]|nr:MAG: type II secretion system protein GspE [Acidobacteriota bacterium]
MAVQFTTIGLRSAGPASRRAVRARGAAALGEVLLDRGVITAEQLQIAIDHQRTTDRRIGHVLIDLGFTNADAVLGGLSLQLGVPSTRLNGYRVSPSAVQAIPEKLARKHLALPLQKVGQMLQVAIAVPTDLAALDELRFASGCQIQTFVALEDEIADAVDRSYGAAAANDAAADEPTAEPVTIDRRDLERPDRRTTNYGRRKSDRAADEALASGDEEPAVAAVDRFLAAAAADGASDVHLERTPDGMRVRFRVDGTFQDIVTLPASVAPAICARVKVLGGMDIAEHRLPQDGRLTVTVGARRLDLRASTYPTIHGEKIVLRVLDQGTLKLELGPLGMRAPVLDEFRDLIRRPEGLVLITGPTGSGKTSTLYAALGELVETGKNITTIENPVEYELAGTNQGQINEKAGFTFARGLRAVLRQDPDVIMVGEIRDPDTLTTAIEASLTGHLVFSTLHTNSAIGTITRLLDMGIEPYFLASGVKAVVAQRLVRRICRHCCTELPVPAGVGHLFGDDAPAVLRRGSGCPECRGTGFMGRVAIYEMAGMTPALRELILARAPEHALLQAALEHNMSTLREQCLARVREGVTTLEEVVRVTQ